MEPCRGVSASISVGRLLLFMIGTVIYAGVADAYVVSPTMPLASSTFSSKIATRIIPNGNERNTGSYELSRWSRPRSLRLYSNKPSTPGDFDSGEKVSDESLSVSSAIANVTSSPTPGVQFGDITPMKRNSSSASSAKFGDVVSISRPSSSSSSASLFAEATPETTSSKSSGLSDVELLKQRRIRNIGVAILSIALAVGNYAYQWTHPVTPIQLLVNMERSSAPLSDIGKNSKPTVIDFWAPWCENCRYMAPTLYQIEDSYKDKVNFVMVNGDDPNNWPLIEALGVDAIPHLALVESDGTVDTALIGAVPKEWLSRDIDVLLDNASKSDAGIEQTSKRPLPHQMLDVFANRPENRKISNLDAIVDSAKR